jgi:acetyltransferase-like isoleucine patch superfamily enzyme
LTYLSRVTLANLGLAAVGEDVLISDRASLHNPSNIRLGSRVRIDDFCLLSAGVGGISFGDNIHFGAYSSIVGAGAVILEDFANISTKVSIFSSSDDFSGGTMTNPTVPEELKSVDHRPVRIGRHAVVGCGSVLLPGVTIAEGAAIGALSLVKGSCEAFTIFAGVPARPIGTRARDLLRIEQNYRRTRGS